MSTFETPSDATRDARLERQRAQYAMELGEIEAEIKRFAALNTVIDQLEKSPSIVAQFEGSKEAVLHLESSILAVRTLRAQEGYEKLLERRRQLKQLLATGKMDLENANAS